MTDGWSVRSVRIIVASLRARRVFARVEGIKMVCLSVRCMASRVRWLSTPSKKAAVPLPSWHDVSVPLACTGCNFRCLNCQNHDISQAAPSDVNHYELSPEDVVALCQKHHCPGIAYTYTEPLTYLEYIIDCARLAHEAGLWNILVTAGYVCLEPLADLLPYLDAANIDLKSFSDDIYKKGSRGHLQPVLDTILAMKQAGACGWKSPISLFQGLTSGAARAIELAQMAES